MKPTRITGSLPKPLGAPDDWKEENGHCGGLFIRPEMIQGVQFLRSAWEAEPNEAMFLLAGGKLVLGVSGSRHPVVHFAYEGLPAEFETVVTARQIATLDGTQAARVEMLFCVDGIGRRGYVEIALATRTFTVAVAEGMEQLYALARREKWIA